MRIGISGYFGYQNLGDELFLRVWKNLFSEHEVFPLCGYEDLTSVDRIIIGGGDLIIPNLFTNAYWRYEFLQKPTWVYGVGVPTRLKARSEVCKKYKNFFEKCEGVFVRDKGSKDWLIKHEVYNNPVVVNDIAWAYKLPQVKFKKLFGKTVGISIRQQSIFDQDNIVKLVSELAREMNILLIPLQPGYGKEWNDISLHEELKIEINRRVKDCSVNTIPPFSNINQRINFIDLVDLYITERMHGMLVSLRVGTSVMPIAVGNKFYRVMERFGLENTIVDSHDYDQMKKVIQEIQQLSFEKQVTSIEKETVNQLERFRKLVLKE